MALAGKLNLTARNFDIFNYSESNTFITLGPCSITLSYLDEQGKLIQLKKDLPVDPLKVFIGSKLVSSDIQDELGGGFLEPTTAQNQNVVAKSLAFADFLLTSSLSNF